MPTSLDKLKGLANKSPQPVEIPAAVSDPAIAGARKVKDTVVLGLDAGFTARAAYCAKAKATLDTALEEYATVQQEMRDYGAGKRIAYNDTYKANVVTVKIPFEVEVPGGKEVRAVSVTCTNKYSVDQTMVTGNKSSLGEAYSRLFQEETAKVLRPNAEELIRGVLKEAGLSDEEVSSSMEALFDTQTRVSTKEHYEKEVLEMPIEIQERLAKMVKRQQPSVKV